MFERPKPEIWLQLFIIYSETLLLIVSGTKEPQKLNPGANPGTQEPYPGLDQRNQGLHLVPQPFTGAEFGEQTVTDWSSVNLRGTPGPLVVEDA